LLLLVAELAMVEQTLVPVAPTVVLSVHFLLAALIRKLPMIAISTQQQDVLQHLVVLVLGQTDLTQLYQMVRRMRFGLMVATVVPVSKSMVFISEAAALARPATATQIQLVQLVMVAQVDLAAAVMER
jgi:phosphatidylserine decarboxylase